MKTSLIDTTKGSKCNAPQPTLFHYAQNEVFGQQLGSFRTQGHVNHPGRDIQSARIKVQYGMSVSQNVPQNI
jgi:hypothetical protein